ncbi:MULTISPECIES: hypothetical protein [unclassified Blastococcus]
MRWLVLLGVGVLAACGGTDESDMVEVSLWHCGVEPVTVDGRLWEAVPEMVDGMGVDATNPPEDWVGRGTVVITDDQMTYTDQGGKVIDFVPDDGITVPAVCA